MKEFLSYLLSLIVDHKDDVHVEEKEINTGMFQYLISLNKDDIGKVIGKEGKIIKAIRNIAKILAAKEGKKIRIDIA